MKNSMYPFYISLILCLVTLTINAQSHISGKVLIDLETGLFTCDFKVQNLPKIEDYKILINKGFNVKEFKTDTSELIEYDGYFEPFMLGEALGYHFRDSKRNRKVLPESFQVSYKGAFPAYIDEWNAFDFKGLIAINDKTLRATEQTKWYPVLYDVANDRIYDSYTYDIEIEIKGGTSIFINGSAPQKAQKSRLISKKAVPLFLFAGDYDFLENNGDYIINTEVSPKNANLIFNNIENIKEVLASKLGKAFTDKIYIINHKAVNKRKVGSSWGFNVYPSFAFTGLDFNKLVEDGGRFTNANTRYFAHEFAHNYFFNNVNSGTLKWFWLESFPEYLSFSVSKDLCGEDYLAKVLLSKANNIKDKEFKSLSDIDNPDQISDSYRYTVGPLMLQCFEDTFGRKKMNRLMSSLLKNAEHKSLTLKDFEESTIEIGVSQSEFEKFKSKYIYSKDFKTNIIQFIEKKYTKQ